MSKRKRPSTPSKTVQVQSLRYFGIHVCPECDEPIHEADEVEWDHRHCVTLGGQDHYTNIRMLHVGCHTEKTIRDIKANAKTKRLEKELAGEPKRKRRKKKIQSR